MSEAPALKRELRTIGPVVAGLVLLVVGGALFAQAVATAAKEGVTAGSPTLAPLVVTGAWVAVAIAYLVGGRAARGGMAVPERGGRARWRTPALLVIVLVAYAVVLKYTVVGYVVATAVFFVASARLLDPGPTLKPARAVILRDGLVAVGLSLGIYLVFTRLLGISLPAGVLPL